MCGRYVLVTKISEIEARFGVEASFPFGPAYNIGPGAMAPVISDDNPKELQLMQFGLTPFWAKKRMYFFNARAEGDHNPENDPRYSGAKGIIKKSAFRKSIRERRCLVIADAFIEGTTEEKLDKPYAVYLPKAGRPFAFAGIWDEWVDTDSGEVVRSFALITAPATPLLQKLPHHRSPVILRADQERKWLDKRTPLADVTAMLSPFGGEMNAYPISAEIKNPRNQGAHLLKPVGPPVFPDKSLKVEGGVSLQGMGFTRARARDEGK